MLQKPLKLISNELAITISLLSTVLYVAVLYLHSNARPTLLKNKDSPSVIKARILLVSCASLLIAATTVYIGKASQVGWATSATKILGLQATAATLTSSVGLTAVLFAGPLFEHLVADGGFFTLRKDVAHAFSSWVGIRNFIAGPFTEELVFRSCIIPLHFFAAFPIGQIILTTPLYFGLAHIHHVYERSIARPGHLLEACIVSLVQFTYTTIFGWFAAYLFFKTGSVWCCVAVHTFCNAMGLPRVTGRVQGPMVYSVMYYLLLAAGSILATRMIDLRLVSPADAYQPYSLI